MGSTCPKCGAPAARTDVMVGAFLYGSNYKYAPPSKGDQEDVEAELREIAAYCPMSSATRERLTRAITQLMAISADRENTP